MDIPASLKRYASKIEEVEDARADYNGWWVYLKDGWKNGDDPVGVSHTIHEDTLKDCAELMRMVRPCDCKDCVVVQAK